MANGDEEQMGKVSLYYFPFDLLHPVKATTGVCEVHLHHFCKPWAICSNVINPMTECMGKKITIIHSHRFVMALLQ